jgi:hypothetical protein
MAGMRLDHISYAAGPEGIAACVQRLGAHLGAGFIDGGLHPRFGTRNFVLPLAAGCYLEVVEALDHPAADTAPFGQAVRACSQAGGGWLGWVVAVDDLAAFEQRLGRPAVPGNRRRPDGVELQWRQLGVLSLMEDPQLPFFVQWQTDPAEHPSSGGGPVRLTGVELAGNPDVIAAYLGVPVDDPLDDVAVSWTDPADQDGETGLLRATFATEHGPVTID